MRRLGVILAVCAMVLAACGDDAATTTGADGGAEAVTVHVTATEFGFTSDVTTFKVGVPYHFVVVDDGQIEHEMMVIDRSMEMPGDMDMDAMHHMALGLVDEEELQPGVTGETDVVFSADDVGKPFELACHLPGHYEAGMHLDITITG